MRFVREVFTTMVEIIEVKQSFEMNRVTYCFIMLLQFMQTLSYIFYSSDTKSLTEEKIKSIQLIFGHSTLIYTLSEFGLDNITEIVYYTIQSFYLLVIIYVITLTLLRMSSPHRFSKAFTTLTPLNKLFNVFLVFYAWIFLVPSLEINSAMLFCSDFTYLRMYQNNCTDYPKQYVYVSLFGIIMLNFFGLSITILYRNYEFNDREVLKRKYSVVSILQYFALTIMITMFWARLGMNWAIACNLAICFTLVYQFTFQFPFRDKSIMAFFAVLGSLYTACTIMTTAWAKIDSLSDTEFFYSLFIATTIFSGASIAIGNKKLYTYLDVYLEEVFKLAEQQNKNDQAKCMLLKVLIMHQDNCTNDVCECKRSSFTDEKGTIELDVVYKLIENIFAWSLNQKVLQNDRSEYENISLKYISFLTKYHNNPAKALYELKVLSTKKQNIGYYFLMISSILTRRIEESLKHVQLFNQSINSRSAKTSNSQFRNLSGNAGTPAAAAAGGTLYSPSEDNAYPIAIDKIIEYEKSIERISASIQIYAKARIKYWERFMKAASLSTNELYTETIKVAMLGTSTDQLVTSVFNSSNTSWKSSAKMVKLLSLFKSVVCNEMHASNGLEQKFQDLLKVDQYKDPQYLSNLNFMKGNFAYMTLSLSKEKGRIVSELNERFLAFFGYAEKEEQSRIKHVNQLMPSFIGNIHSNLIDNYLSRGHSHHINNSFFSFALSKQGFLLPINLYLNNTQLYPHDYTLNGLFVAVNSRTDYIVSAANGQIVGLSAQAFELIFNNQQMQEQKRLSSAAAAHMPGAGLSPRNSKFTKIINVKFLHGVKDVVSKLNMYFIMPDLAHEIARQIIQSARINQLKETATTATSTSTGSLEQIRLSIPIKVPRDIILLQNRFFATIDNYAKVMRNTLSGGKSSSNNMSETQHFFSSNHTKVNNNNNPSNSNNNINKSEYQQTSEGDANIIATALEIGHNIILQHESAMAISFSNFYNENSKEWENNRLATSLEAQITVHLNRMHYVKDQQQQQKSHYVIELKDIRPVVAPEESLIENELVTPAIDSRRDTLTGRLLGGPPLVVAGGALETPFEPMLLPENEFTLQNMMLIPNNSMNDLDSNTHNNNNNNNKNIQLNQLPTPNYQQHYYQSHNYIHENIIEASEQNIEYDVLQLSQQNNFSYQMSIPAGEALSFPSITYRIDNIPSSATYRHDHIPLKSKDDSKFYRNSISVLRSPNDQSSHANLAGTTAIISSADDLVGGGGGGGGIAGGGDSMNPGATATAIGSAVQSAEELSGMSQLVRHTNFHQSQQNLQSIASPLFSVSNSNTQLFTSTRKEPVKLRTAASKVVVQSTAKLDRFHEEQFQHPALMHPHNLRSSDRSDAFTSTQRDSLEPRNFGFHENGTSKQHVKSNQMNSHMHRANVIKKHLLQNQQNLNMHIDNGSSVSSMKSFKSSSEEIIPQIIKRNNPMSLIRLKVATSAIILAFIGLSMLIVGIDLPILQNIVDMMDDFKPVQDLSISYLQAQLYSLIFSGMKNDLYPVEISSQYINEIVSASKKQMLNYNNDSDTVMKSKASVKSLDSDERHTVYVFPNQEIHEMQVNFEMHQSINNDKIMLAAKYSNLDKVHIESLLFLQRNLALNIEESDELSESVTNLLYTYLDELDNKNIEILYCTIGAYTLIIAWSAFVITRINSYMLKILHLITRLSYPETASEIDKFTRIAELSSIGSKDTWIRIDFKKIMLNDSYRRSKQRDALMKLKKDQNISSIINDAKLPFAGSIAVIVSLSIISLFFLGMFVAIQKSLIQKIIPQVKLYDAIVDAHRQFSTLSCISETLATHNYIQDHLLKKVSPIAEIIGELSEQFDSSIEAVRAFNSNYTEFLQNYGEEKQELQEIFQGNLCSVFPSALSCAALSPNAESFSKGLVGFLAKSLSLTQVYSDLIYNEVVADDYEEVLLEFVSQQTHTDLIIRNFDVPQISFSRSADIVIDNMQSSIKRVETFTYVYVFGGLVFLTAFLFFSSNLFVFQQEKLIKLMNFSLYLIPYHKLSEENTRHLLKQILMS